MPDKRKCRLCGTEEYLRQGQFIPAACYRNRLKLEYATRNGSGVVKEQVRAPLLCTECEKRFDQNGESEVLRHIAPKSVMWFPPHERLRLALPPEVEDDSVSRFAGDDIGLDMDKFAYFALSMVWRSIAHQWVLLDGTVPPPVQVGAFEEPIRTYLLGKGPLSPDRIIYYLSTRGSHTDSEVRRYRSKDGAMDRDGQRS